MILAAIEQAVAKGARRARACEVIGLDRRTEQRWRRRGGGRDRRSGRSSNPPNKLRAAERKELLDVANSKQFRNLSPKQIVPILADTGRYIASESTLYRLLREQGQMTHRRRSRPPASHRPREYTATAPCQVWSWDITYLRSAVRGCFYYLYLIEDIWSRLIVGYEVHGREDMALSAALVERTCGAMGVQRDSLVLHADNGGPMRGSTMLATLQKLGVIPSFSRPRVSDDNAYCESLFRTLKYRPSFPRDPFESIAAARVWVQDFVHWYNHEHLHSGINYVTPASRHEGHEHAVLIKRHAVYQNARNENPERWTGSTRNWRPAGHVRLNPRLSHRNQSPGQTVPTESTKT